MADKVVVENTKWIRKQSYWGKLNAALDTYKNMLIIGVDFVGSKQMQQVRMALRGKGIVLMGKNTIIRKVFRERAELTPTLESLMPHIFGNVGFIFTNGDLNAIRQMVVSNKVPAGAKTGVVAPIDVVIPAGPTGLDPGQTAFFQTLGIGTKIVKGSIEMTTPSKVCTKGEKITASAVALLNKLNIRPFEYGIKIDTVYDNGSTIGASFLDMTDDTIVSMFANAASKLAAVSFALGHVNQCTMPHSFGRAFRMVCALALQTNYDFDELKAVKEMIANPGAFAPSGGNRPAEEKKAPAAAAAPEPEPIDEDVPPIGSIFDDKGSDY